MAEMQVTKETVNGAKAAAWLTKNTHNRHIQDAKVAEYALAMKEGRWTEGTGAFIAFSNEDEILNGQHTLTALVQADVTLELVVYRGVDPKAQSLMDIGARRRFTDALTLAGEPDSNNIAAATNMLYYWDKGLRGTGLTSMGNSTVKRAQIPQLLEYFQEHADELREGTGQAKKVRKAVKTSNRLLALAWIVFNRIDSEDAAFFFDRLETGEGLMKNDPLFLLRKRLLEESMKISTGRISSAVLLGLIMKAWNLYRDGAEIQTLTFRPGGSSKEAFPEPH